MKRFVFVRKTSYSQTSHVIIRIICRMKIWVSRNGPSSFLMMFSKFFFKSWKDKKRAVLFLHKPGLAGISRAVAARGFGEIETRDESLRAGPP